MNGVGLSPARAEVKSHLEDILASPVFKRAERQSLLLSYVVNHTLAGNTGAVREASIGVDVYGRPTDFDPREDTFVRVEASRLRTRLLEYYESDGKNDQTTLETCRAGMAAKDDLRIVANCSGFHSLMGNHEICSALFRDAVRNHPRQELAWRMRCEQHYRANRYQEVSCPFSSCCLRPCSAQPPCPFPRRPSLTASMASDVPP
ncbi:MAG: hypothetical protein FJW20_02690 [Acidimicrobiia bacterium]|nr:hypothetical protein [Acidimicrobiia bacterium]